MSPKKRNALLIGDAGVGKTAIVNHLARNIAQGMVPEQLKDYKMFELDIIGLTAGTRYRGDFEERIKDLMDILHELRPLIMVVEDLQMLFGVGGTSNGSMDASSMLKPLLTTPQISFIGSTSFDDYREHIEKDKPFTRRFQKVEVLPPSDSMLAEILNMHSELLAKYHGVCFEDGLINEIIKLSKRYLPYKVSPDREIDCLDQAAVAEVLANYYSSSKTELFEQTVKSKKSAVSKSANQKASLKPATSAKANLKKKPPRVTKTSFRKQLASLLNLKVEQLLFEQSDHLINLQQQMGKKIFGQDEAVKSVTKAVLRAKAELNQLVKPLGCFMFCGPTGVGKTEVTNVLSEQLQLPLIRFDMSEFIEAHSVSRLIGAPPGYVGFQQGGQLTIKVEQTPHCVVLLDEIEKAHKDVWNILLQIMDYGKLTDSSGKQVDFRQTFIIMTSNVGAQSMEKGMIGFNPNYSQQNVMEEVKKTFTPEFRNRLDAIIQFKFLSNKEFEAVVVKFLSQFADLLAERNVAFKYNKLCVKCIIERVFSNPTDRNLGARIISRFIDLNFKSSLASELLFGTLKNGGSVELKSMTPAKLAKIEQEASKKRKDLDKKTKTKIQAKTKISKNAKYIVVDNNDLAKNESKDKIKSLLVFKIISNN